MVITYFPLSGWQPSTPVIADTRSNPKKPPGNKPGVTSTPSTTGHGRPTSPLRCIACQ